MVLQSISQISNTILFKVIWQFNHDVFLKHVELQILHYYMIIIFLLLQTIENQYKLYCHQLPMFWFQRIYSISL